MKLPKILLTLAFLAPAAGAAAQPGHDEHHTPSAVAAPALATPESIRHEHAELHDTLARAGQEAGALGAAARGLSSLLDPHFRREEEIATPPLGLLRPLATGPATAEMRAALPMTQALERELPQMLAEHRRIGEARERFEAAARQANRADYVAFSQALAAHARHEEEVLYPAAVLVGRYVASQTKAP
jgi:hypothetical protein